MTAEASSYAIIFPVAAILLTVVLIPLVRRLAIYAGYVDEPGGRKTHAEPIPPIGGIVVFSVFMALSAFLPSELGDIRAFYAALVLVLVTGIIDDAKPVNAKLKFLIHFMAAGLVVIFGGAQIETLGDLLGFGDMQLGTIAATLFSVACVVYIINAINMMDGLDGLAVGCVVIATIAYSVLSYLTGNIKFSDYLLIPYIRGAGELTVFCASIIGAGLGFLWFNCFPAAIFMGDVGSLALGGALGTVAVLIKKEFLLMIVGGIFVMEAMSVILQVASFKLFKKRIFKIAPLHHHFQFLGWKENKVIVRFWILAIIFAFLTLVTLKTR